MSSIDPGLLVELDESSGLGRKPELVPELEQISDGLAVAAIGGNASAMRCNGAVRIYTQVSIRKLKQIHAATHPSAKRGRFAGAAQDEPPEPEISRAEFLSSLAAEDKEDAGAAPISSGEGPKGEL